MLKRIILNSMTVWTGEKMPQLIQPEVQALLLDAKGKIPAVLMDDDVIEEAISMRDRIGMDYAMTWLQYKGMSADDAQDILKAVRH